MNREYKFRAWEPLNKSMIYFDGIIPFQISDKFVEGALGLQNQEKRYLTTMNYDDIKLMQFTRLRERTSNTSDNKEIYECDIVKCWGGEYHQGYWEHNETIVIKDMINDCFMMGENEYIKVIGNTYENPELIPKTGN